MDLENGTLATLKAIWPWPWLRSKVKVISLWITHRVLPTYQIWFESEKLYVDVRTDGRSDTGTEKAQIHWVNSKCFFIVIMVWNLFAVKMKTEGHHSGTDCSTDHLILSIAWFIEWCLVICCVVAVFCGVLWSSHRYRPLFRSPLFSGKGYFAEYEMRIFVKG